MLDELELLKQDWQKKEEQLPKLSYNEIYVMIWKKSSSIVKWIFYISIIELLFWIVVNTVPFFMESYQEIFDVIQSEGFDTFFIISTIFTYTIILIFIYYLYKAYKEISVTDDVKSLMESILRTRKIVSYYVGYNIVMAILVTIYTFYHSYTYDERTIKLFSTIKEDGSELRFWLLSSVIVVVGILVMVGFIWLFYKLIYGFLLKKLNKNYKELKRLEI
jgi:hypothetical protein